MVLFVVVEQLGVLLPYSGYEQKQIGEDPMYWAFMAKDAERRDLWLRRAKEILERAARHLGSNTQYYSEKGAQQ